ncbi:geranylgeranylglycerol-phosphate geranylgeranyltransferase [Flavobacteriaceae bacterium S0825]|uniref:geranylgeranylglycerol-phosphate geranylgeranyltransferase n=1 Tax=Gaetbulibacter sp. S0825 TaxID=2720084 RepID=UPI00142FC127|nr:geranylgeranylglycerol-phosphate geranylgeranyltransferase [Gaetbulibacter sp. S0825]MCK0109409.1 geranylgeranylglycerol-phosphate geranylgeranyltransferase [Flavobacteriaceae bacterium S0825]NIX65043.1 UbiA family prenyltransferase [Gaetbulibacter sp. S0825]
MTNILNLIRWKNLLLIALVQVLVKYALFESYNIQLTLNTLQFTLLVLATILIAAAGNIINDIYDIETDLVNKPEKVIVNKTLSEKTALNLFIALNLLGVGLGFYLSNVIGRSGFSVIFVLISALLYIYASYLKQTLLLGNILVSALVGLSILIVPVFDLIPSITSSNRELYLYIFKIAFTYAIFAFMINLLREIIKDIEDVNGDYKAQMKTLPILIGRDRTTMVVFALSFIPLLAVVNYIVSQLYNNMLAVIYFLIFVVGPMLYFTIKVFSAEQKKDYQHLSNVLKVIMLFGVLSLLLYPFVIN